MFKNSPAIFNISLDHISYKTFVSDVTLPFFSFPNDSEMIFPLFLHNHIAWFALFSMPQA